MDTGYPFHTDDPKVEVRFLSIGVSLVFLAVVAIHFIFVGLDSSRYSQLFDGQAGPVLLFAPLAFAGVSIARLCYLRFARDTLIPFVDGWFIHVCVVALYTTPYVLALFFTWFASV